MRMRLVSIAAVFGLATTAVTSVAAQREQTVTARRDDAPQPAVAIAGDGTLTVNSGSRPRLRAVLEAIAAHARIPIVLSDTLEEERVSRSLRSVPLEQGLQRLLERYDAFFLYSAADGKSPGVIAAIWVYQRGEGRPLEPVPPALWASTKELEALLDDPDPGIRSEIYEALIERQGDRALATVVRGLADADESVRLMSLQTAASEGVEIPAADLRAVLLADQSYAVRRLALEALDGRPEAEAVAEQLIDDPDEHIRHEAALMLERLKAREPRPMTPKRP